jgi:hypothetical protein
VSSSSPNLSGESILTVARERAARRECQNSLQQNSDKAAQIWNQYQFTNQLVLKRLGKVGNEPTGSGLGALSGDLRYVESDSDCGTAPRSILREFGWYPRIYLKREWGAHEPASGSRHSSLLSRQKAPRSRRSAARALALCRFTMLFMRILEPVPVSVRAGSCGAHYSQPSTRSSTFLAESYGFSRRDSVARGQHEQRGAGSSSVGVED